MSHSLTPTALLLAVAAALPASSADVAIEKVEVGFGGAYKAGEWTPLTLKLGGALPPGAVVETETTDADGAAVVRRGAARAASGASELQTSFQSGRLGSDLTVRLRSSDGTLLAERRYRSGSETLPDALPKGATLWIAAWGSQASADKVDVPLAPARVTSASISGGLPSDQLGYAAADLVFIRGDLAPTPEQADAVRKWVAGGGHLAIALGRHTEAFRRGPLATWVPVEVGDQVQLFDLTKLEAYARSDRRLPRARRVTVARLGDAAETLLDGPEGGLIARGPYGFGRVTAFAFDFDVPPFSNWVGLKDVLGRALLDAEGTAAGSDRSAEAGVTDLATQLLRAEELLPGVDRPTTGHALWLLLIYAAVVGPVDYLIVHRVLRRPALTWVTLPLIVLGAAWWLDRDAAANGRSSQVSRLDLVDVDAASGTLRGRSFTTLYSVDSTRADLAVAPTTGESWELAGAPAASLGWTAPPEDAFGGVFRDASGGLFGSEYLVLPPGDAPRAERLPLVAAGTRRFASTWQRGDAAGLVESNLVARSRGLVEGRITHRLPGPLVDYLIAFGDRVYQPREKYRPWHPGDAVDPGSAAFLRQDLSSFLTRAQTKQVKRKPGEGGQDYVVTEGRYDPLSTDPEEIVRMLTFHRAAGGTDYTGLTNVALGTHDLSTLLDLGRIVILGRLDADAAEVTVEPASGPAFETARTTTFVRLVLPVARAATDAPVKLVPAKSP